MTPRQQTAGIVVLALLAGVAGWWLGQDRQWPPPPELPPGTEVLAVGDAAPALTLPAPTGEPVVVLPRPGRRVLINFWASWCPPCVKEMPLLDRAAQADAANGLDVVGIALEEPQPVLDFLQRHPVSYAIVTSPIGTVDLSTRLGNTRGVLPYSVLIGADGRIAATHLGELDDAKLRALLARAGAP